MSGPSAESPPGSKKQILVFCEFYRPGTRAGGGMWTVANLADRFSDRYEFRIFTRNHDSGSPEDPYSGISSDGWNVAPEARIYYASPKAISAATARDVAEESNPDAVFLNSVFGRCGIAYLEARRRRLVPRVPTIVAPCGELSRGALRSKTLKKRAFLAYARVAGLFRNVIWKASSHLERDEIVKIFGEGCEVRIAPDLTPKSILPNFSIDNKPAKKSGEVRLIFFSRIVPKKNLRFLLERLSNISAGRVDLQIVGPLEDADHWNACRSVIERLPANINVDVVGPVSYLEGLNWLCENHFFVLPTLNENFGYVILESLAAGSPVIISDNTSWSDLQRTAAGSILSLDDPEQWELTIRRAIDMDQTEYRRRSAAAREFAVEYLGRDDIERQTAAVLEHALSSAGMTSHSQTR